MAFFIRDSFLDIPTHLLWHLDAVVVGGDHLHLVAGGLAQGPCTLRQAVRLDTTLADIFTVVENLLKACRLILSRVSLLTLGLLHYIALMSLLLSERVLTDHGVLIMTFFYEGFCA